MSRFFTSAIVWGVYWFGSFAALEFTPIFWKNCPWTTLSTFAKTLETRWVWAALIFLIGLSILNIHIVGSFIPKLIKVITE